MTIVSQPNQKSKLLFVVTKSNWGGAQRYVYDLATNLPTNRFEVTVAAGGGGTLLKRLSEKGLHTVEIPHMVRDINLFTDFRVFRFILELIKVENPQILHLNSSKAAVLGSLAGRLCGVPNIIFTAHGWPFSERRDFVSKLFIFTISWVTTVLAHKVIAVSRKDANLASSFPFVRKSKIHMIHNGVSTSKLADKITARKALQKYCSKPIAIDDYWIGTVGELHKNKNQRMLIDAVLNSKLPNLKVLIIGDGEEYDSLSKYIHELKATQIFYFLGYVEGAAFLLSALDLFVLPSTKEGLPYALLEAGLAQLPVIASNVGGIPDLINHKQNGLLCNALNLREFTSTLRFIVSNYDCQETLSTALFEKVSNDFTLTEMIRKTQCLY